jgi:hypothetical protein
MSTYKGLVTFTSLLLVLLGVGMLSFTIAHGGGVGLILGTLFIAAGAGRLWLMRRRP